MQQSETGGTRKDFQRTRYAASGSKILLFSLSCLHARFRKVTMFLANR